MLQPRTTHASAGIHVVGQENGLQSCGSTSWQLSCAETTASIPSTNCKVHITNSEQQSGAEECAYPDFACCRYRTKPARLATFCIHTFKAWSCIDELA